MTIQAVGTEVPTFLGDLSILDLRTEYRSLKENPVRDFYRPCLLNSTDYRRSVGFFRSTVYNVIGDAMIEFARRGGKAKLVCSPELTEEDVDSIVLGYASKSDIVVTSLIQQIEALLASDETASATRMLATLIAVGALEVKVAVRADRKGLYHEKIGIFADSIGNTVSFKGSANETWSGWHTQGNFESIEVFCSWRGGLEKERVRNHTLHFDTLWAEQDPDIEVFPFPTEAVTHLTSEAYKDLDSVETKNISTYNKKRRSPLPHQSAAVGAWISHGSRGIFEHATGSGKTYTALMAIRQHLKSDKPALVVVPSRLLLEQWATEIREEIPEAALLLAGAGNNSWRYPQRLKGMTGPDTTHGKRVVLATMQTASSDRFRNGIFAGEHLMIVADEVHQIGSPWHTGLLTIETGPRLGLSATPIRYGDPDGTAQIFRYFEHIIPPPITLTDAVDAGRLVPYEYFPHPVNLTVEEAEEWKNYTERIRLEIIRQKPDDSGVRPISDRAKMLLIQRSRIAKKAQLKANLACNILKDHYTTGQSWLVYCEDGDQLSQVIEILQQEGLEPVEYHSKMTGDRVSTMSWFRRFGGILVSIRCLDEGVDIPDVSHAIILASSQNPRQFIQRRGRVLRRAFGKQIAVIHDAIVLPVSAEDEPEQTSLLKSELTRAIEFADHAINKGAGAELRRIAIDLGIDPEYHVDSGVEEEVEET